MKKSRLSYKQVKELVEKFNDSRGLKLKDKGHMHLGGDSGWYELFVTHEQGSTGVRSIKRGTLKECTDAFYEYKLSH